MSPRAVGAPGGVLAVRALSAAHHGALAIHRVSLDAAANEVTALIGPPGSGKTTLLRCLNRLHEQDPGAWVEGSVRVNGTEIYAPGIDLQALRASVGLIGDPQAFATASVAENVAAGLRFSGAPEEELIDGVERALRRVGLWETVRDELGMPASALTACDGVRLAFARSIALGPSILLVDEVTAGLDPSDVLRIEALLVDLARDVTVVLATGDLAQVRRIADSVAVLLEGELVEAGPAVSIFSVPRDPRTERYITGASD